MTARILVLGGTGEARRLAALLQKRYAVVSSLAGRVSNPALPVGKVRIGGFGGVEGLTVWLRDNDIDAVIDATHPFASTMTASAAEATQRLGLPFVVVRRPPWQPQPGDDWLWVDDIAAVPAVLPGERVFLTTGRTDLAVFADLDAFWFLVRTVDPPRPPLPKRCAVILDRGPYTVDGELALLREHRIDVLVSKNSGGELTAAKLVAARERRLPVVMVRRPPLPPVETVASEQEAVHWLRDVIPDSGAA
ncbi:cobalt-precorrin-6A reductase [Fodinicola acaciae]|uniref:cobalt-precorrin-6A reductase n=1 Tax=Fodinicola acaciae TaxID=2681555 RepID=UPI001C9E9873|nr:cobalt-precorrin-6A reductase [Fodinicola acaciae]